ncbi:MAG: putative translation factor [Gammaproteobacteria bacterium]|jgi:tRNA threonylcarbamoyl adenosine modification protein (Sua5/YciO/YrdC/YwlC family)|nr:putative translation factor [Gammaproteobacteria bacterium]
MSQFFHIHPDNPQSRLVRQAVNIIRQGGVIVYPTDSGYALGCHLGDKEAVQRIRQIRRLDDNHLFTIVCRDLSELSAYAKVDNQVYRLLRAFTPGPYTFILTATKEVPRRLIHPNRKTIGLRIPEHVVALSLLEALEEPMISTTLILAGEETPMIEPEAMREVLGKSVDLIIDGGNCGIEPTSVIDLTEEKPKVIRQGKGDVAPFLEE